MDASPGTAASRWGNSNPLPRRHFERFGAPDEVTTTTELKKSLTFHLDAGQTRYVKLSISMGFMVGHVYPELVENTVGASEIQKTKSTSK